MTDNLMRKRGFTIIETLVAVGILAVVIIGAMSAIQSSISSYIFSKDQIVAFYLAQEGFEHIKNLRDENRIHQQGNPAHHWLNRIAEHVNSPCYFGHACYINIFPPSSTTPVRCASPTTCPVLRQDPATGRYGYDASWNATGFRRTITVTSINANEVAVTVTINWSKGVVNREFKARENLFNW